MSIQSINPYNSEVLNEYNELSEKEIESRIADSYKAFLNWRSVPFDKRAEMTYRLADLLEKKEEGLARVITSEMGKIKSESIAEVNKCAWVCRYYAENAEKFLKEEKIPVDEADSYIAYDPLGPVLAIMPWNFPFWQVFRFAAPNIMAGNTGILKHASNVPQCGLEIEKLFHEAGFPESVFQTFLIKTDKVPGILADYRVKAVTLTGSEAAGKKVAEQAGSHLKKQVLELGGSDPFIVLEDADISEAVKTGIKARMINCGQSCIAAKRFILHRNIADEYLEGFRKSFQGLKSGNPWEESTDFGPMARNDLAAELDEQVAVSLKKGADLMYGGRKMEGNGAFFKPGILTGVKPGMPGFDEELFGPVASVIIVDHDDEAVEIANKSPYGLGASLWTGDIDKARIFARRIESGSVFVNAMVASHPKVPFGGVKASGYGRELSHLGIREFMNIKSVWINS